MVNFIFISPNFPERYFKWCESLKNRGIRVLGIGDGPHYDLSNRLLACLSEYYFLPKMDDFEALKKAVSYYEEKYGKIDFIESNNEWWLQSDAKLREIFHVDTGFHPDQMEHIKAKSAMKEYFHKGGAKTMRYLLIHGKQDKEKAVLFQQEVGWPLFVKPNVGVGASDSYALHNQEEFDSFFERELPEPYIMEEFVEGTIVSFDGICDEDSNAIFHTSEHFPIPPAELVNENADDYYYANPFSLPMDDIDKDEFEKVGMAVVKAFQIKKRFFHIEFFVLGKDKPGLGKKGDFVGLECNMRPPGGNSPDLIDYAESLSVYEVYADIIAYNENRQDLNKKKYYSFTASRRDCYQYLHSEAEILEAYKDKITAHGRYPKHISDDMGDTYYFARFETLEEGREFAAYCRKKKD